MNILLAFSPFLVFVVLQRLIGVEPGLLGALTMSLLLLARDAVIRRKLPKVLEIGTALLFGGVALYLGVAGAAWSIAGVRLAVDAGLLLIVLVSMAIGQPFTLQYAREGVPQVLWHQAEFVRVNIVITAVWAAAFAALAAIDLVWLLIPALPPRVAIIATVLALLGAVKFTGWYPERERAVSAHPTNA
ncbi:MAG TPA: hypothetical protein VGI78_25005 [Acetobacteraceae bacterium]|jgi:hypothetical protein